MAHSWVQMFDSQYEVFKTYCQTILTMPRCWWIPTMCLSGVPDAIRAFDEVLAPGIRKCGIRLTWRHGLSDLEACRKLTPLATERSRLQLPGRY